jgi:two-component system sensor histidine kinase/response regulator
MPRSVAGELDLFKNIEILLVDDKVRDKRALKEMLLEIGIKPTLAENGEGTLRLLQKKWEFAAVIMDSHLTDMNGFDLAKMIKKDAILKNIAIIILASEGQKGDAEKCRIIGIDAYLTRPIRKQILCNTLKQIIIKKSDSEDAKLITRHSIRVSHLKLKVLLAEDNPINQKVAKRMLEKMGYQITVVDNGLDVLQKLENEKFDLILMDVQMPRMDGFVATKKIREIEKNSKKHVPIIALTAHAMKGDREKCIQAGMDGYVSKPIKFNELLEQIESFYAAMEKS